VTARSHNRKPELIPAFAARLRMMLGHSGVRQSALAEICGGFSNQRISRLVTGAARTIPLDLLVGLCRWAATNNYSVVWLTTGQGDMLTPQPATQGDQP